MKLEKAIRILKEHRKKITDNYRDNGFVSAAITRVLKEIEGSEKIKMTYYKDRRIFINEIRS